ncbi:MAG: 4Fe-4S binding protein [Firmicutes bacterium]|nr:4Fe-4S binding protein [Bacillota bacterium]
MARIRIDAERCKGCGLCKEFCPRGIITLAEHFNRMGYHPAIVSDLEKCTGCAACARMCPDVAIEVYR